MIACDQFTSEPEYWQAVADLVGDAPSTYHITLPEVYLETPEEARRVEAIRQTMHDYLRTRPLRRTQGVRAGGADGGRQDPARPDAGARSGAVRLQQGSTSLIRATEGTILERIPPRVRIRSGAPLELPHILVLIDDPERTVIEPLVAQPALLPPLYDFELMLGSGHLTGLSRRPISGLEQQVIAALAQLADPAAFAAKYGLPARSPPLLFAMGDGNHSLATAKAIWEQVKPQVGMDHPARYALVEIENIHDEGLEFEPIHRVLFDVKEDFLAALDDFYRRIAVYCVPCANARGDDRSGRQPGTAPGSTPSASSRPEASAWPTSPDPPSNLPVGTLQTFLDAWGKQGGYAKIDYVHGDDVVVRLGSAARQRRLLPAGHRQRQLFQDRHPGRRAAAQDLLDGRGQEKRFYMEARRIA